MDDPAIKRLLDERISRERAKQLFIELVKVPSPQTVPTANYGPGEEQYAHTDNDIASIERTTDAARVFAFMMLAHLT